MREHMTLDGFSTALIIIGLLLVIIAGSMKFREWTDPEYRARVQAAKRAPRRRHHH